MPPAEKTGGRFFLLLLLLFLLAFGGFAPVGWVCPHVGMGGVASSAAGGPTAGTVSKGRRWASAKASLTCVSQSLQQKLAAACVNLTGTCQLKHFPHAFRVCQGR